MTLRTDLCRQRGGRPGSWPPEGNPYLHAMSHWGWSTPSGFQCSSWPKGSHTGPAYSWDSGGTAPRWAGLWVLLLVGVAVIRVRWGWGRPPCSSPFPHLLFLLLPPTTIFLQSETSLVWDTSFWSLKTDSKEQWTESKVELAPCFPFVLRKPTCWSPRVLSFIPQTFLEHLPCARPCFQDIGHTDKSPPSKAPNSKCDEKVMLLF